MTSNFKLTFIELYRRYLRPHRRLILVTVLVVVVVVGLLHGTAVLAQDKDATSFAKIPLTPDGLLQFLTRILLLVTRLFLSITIFILTFVVEIAGYNGFLTSTAVSVGWVMVRDITNMGFVVILLIIAFGTILGLEQYEWKKLLVKFVLAAILVNFSRIICGVIIDIAQVVMITFVNGVAATAGGNLINAFGLTQIQTLSKDAVGLNDSSIFLAAVAAVTFSSVVMVMMGVFLFMLLARMVVLWVLIVLSPLAFVLSVIPQTQKYATEWWSEFGSNVVTGPVLVFFIWLSFVTVGSGNAHQEIQEKTSFAMDNAGAVTDTGGDQELTSGVSKVMSWNSMANFAIAIGMLAVGAKAAQQLGGVGGSAAAGAIDFGKKVATVASGVAAARWAVGKAKEIGKKGIQLAAYHAPVVGGREWEQRAKIVGESLKGLYYGRATEVTAEGEKTRDQLEEEKKTLENMTPEGRAALAAEVTALEENKTKLQANLAKEGATEEEKAAAQKELEETDKSLTEKKAEQEKAKGDKEAQEKKVKGLEKTLQGQMGGGILGALARRGVALEKQLDKTKNQAENRYKLARKRVGSEAGGYLIGMGTKGVFGLLGDRYAGIDAQDRIEVGWFQAEEERSRAKDSEKNTEGRWEALGIPRLKYDVKKKKLGYQFDRGSVADQVEGHKVRAEVYENRIHGLQTHAREHMMEKAEETIKNLENDDNLKGIKGSMDKFTKDINSLRTTLRDLTNVEAARKRQENYTRDLKGLQEGPEKLSLEQATERLGGKGEAEKIKKILAEAEETAKKHGGKEVKTVREELRDTEHKRSQVLKDYSEAFEKMLKTGIPEKGEDGKVKIVKPVKAIPAWELAREKATKKHHDLFFAGKEEKMLDDAAQRHIWDAKGIVTPNNAHLGIIDQLGKDFKPMNYEAAVAAIQSHMASVIEKRQKTGKVDFEDTAIATALLQKLEEGKWIDDGIIPFRKIAADFAEAFGESGQRLQGNLADRQQRAQGSTGGGGGGGGGFSREQIDSTGRIVKNVLGAEAQSLKDLIKSGGTILEEKLRANIGKGLDVGALGAAGLPNGAVPEELVKALASRLKGLSPEQIEQILRQS